MSGDRSRDSKGRFGNILTTLFKSAIIYSQDVVLRPITWPNPRIWCAKGRDAVGSGCAVAETMLAMVKKQARYWEPKSLLNTCYAWLFLFENTKQQQQ